MIYHGIKTAIEIFDEKSTVKEFPNNKYHVFSAEYCSVTIGIPFKTHADKKEAEKRAVEIQSSL